MTINQELVLKNADSLKIMPIKDVNYHINTELTLYFVLAGSLSIYKNGKIILLESGNLYLINEGEIIALSGYEDNLTACLKIKGSVPSLANHFFLVNQGLSLTYYGEFYQKAVRIFALLIMEMHRKEPGYELLLQGGIQSLLGLFYRYVPFEERQNKLGSSSDEPEKLTEILAYIQGHYHEKIGLSELAELFFINKYYLAHLFKNHLGLSVGNYIQEVRLMNGVRMLETTTKTVTEIALGNGFANVRSFNTAFKERNGMTPIQYRKKQIAAGPTLSSEASSTPNVYVLLAEYLTESELSDLQPQQVTKITEEINLSQVIARRMETNYVLRGKPENITADLAEICEPIGLKYVSLNRLFIRDWLVVSGESWQLDYLRIERELAAILSNRLIPYIQIQAVDYDDFLATGLQPDTFQDVLQDLAYFLQSHYEDSAAWVVEFRCFYEEEDNISLCTPLVSGIELFVEIIKVMVHLPVQPDGSEECQVLQQGNIITLDDRGLMKQLSLKEVLTELSREKYLTIINESKNMFYQDRLLASVREFEDDGYYEQFSDLSQANMASWFYLKQNDYRKNYMWPLSLDGEPIFYYYPAALSAKASLQNRHSLLTEQWHALVFLKQLYQDVVYQDDYFIVTKSSENYRILVTYGESEHVEQIMSEADNSTEAYVYAKITVPFLELNLQLKGLSGRYKLTEQELTPETQKMRHELNRIGNSRKLSLADKCHFKDMNRPSRHLKEVDIKGSYQLNLKVPLYGMILFGLDKIG